MPADYSRLYILHRRGHSAIPCLLKPAEDEVEVLPDGQSILEDVSMFERPHVTNYTVDGT